MVPHVLEVVSRRALRTSGLGFSTTALEPELADSQCFSRYGSAYVAAGLSRCETWRHEPPLYARNRAAMNKLNFWIFRLPVFCYLQTQI